GALRLAFSGLCAYPFRSAAVEEALAASGPKEQRVRHALTLLPGPVREDFRAGREYRLHLTVLALGEILENLEEAE
ncbi:MAG: hypothetical protein JW760_11085, partial [Spirochaetales bacterium]|nr:hypothetical protein [Spirochaetales bacterium]